MPREHDLIILGSGSTAFAAALRAQSHGARVLMVEKGSLGGTCINWGCIPSKTLIHSALFYQEARLGARLGLGLQPGEIDFPRLMSHKNNVVDELRQTKYIEVLEQVPGLEVVRGTGRFTSPTTLQAGERLFEGERFLIATGGYPSILKIPGLEGVPFLTSKSALMLKEFPRSLVIIGGGVIALELGQMFQRLGTDVTILEHGPKILPAFEPEASRAIYEALTEEGVRIHLNAAICSVAERDGMAVVESEIAGSRKEFSGERLLLAVGTAPATRDIGLEKAGVELDAKGFVKVDNAMRTSAPGIWAAGDVTGGMMIATVGAREGITAVENMFNTGCDCRMDYLTAPMAIFTDPEVAMVGHTEESAVQAGYDVVTSTLPVRAIPKALVTGHTAGVIKMVADRNTGRLLGIHLASHRGADLINEAALALRLHATIDDLANTLHVYPSMGEGLRLCAQGFTRDVSRLSCCAE